MSHLVVAWSDAEFSARRHYRYTLTRRFADGPAVAFIGLNPSTADEHQDDPTIRRCLGHARRWGYGELVMLNLYAWRSTDPRGLLKCEQPEGEPIADADRNLIRIAHVAHRARLVVCAWGANPGPTPGRAERVLNVVRSVGTPIVALGLTKHGQPRHPLYTKSDITPVPYPSKETR